MKISGIDLFTYRLPLKRPLMLSSGTITERRGYLIKLTSESGAVGWGEAAPLPSFSAESLEETEQQLRTLKKHLLSATFSADFAKLTGGFESQPFIAALAPSARCGIEMAVLNTLAAEAGVSLANLLTERPAEEVALNGLITDDESATEGARRLLHDGFHTVKLKVGRGTVADDIKRVHQVSLELGSETTLRLDANQAWSFDDAVRFTAAVGNCPIEYIEEPLADPSRLPEFCARTGCDVALDESLIEMTPDDLRNHTYLAAVVLKPTLIGGFEKTAALAGVTQEINVKVVISSTFESSVGIAALVHLAAAMNTPGVATGLDTLRRFQHDLLSQPFEAERGSLNVARVSRAAHSVDESRLDRIGHD